MENFGAIFDWDGVIIDSSAQHEKGWEILAREEKRALPPNFFKRSFGMKNENVIPDLLQWTSDPQEINRLARRKESLYRELVCQHGIHALPGVEVFLDRLRDAGVPSVIASSTPRANIESVIDQLKVRPYFRDIVSGEDVKQGKPNPEVFLKAAARIAMQPNRCIVFEDAHVGVAAGLAAGMKVVAVATTHPADSLRDAHRVVKRLDELNVPALANLMG